LAQQPNRPAIAFRHLGLSHNANSMTDDMAGMDAYDLAPERWPQDANIVNHPVVSRFLEGAIQDEGEKTELGFGEEYSIDDIYNVHQNYPLIDDADSSQHSALIDAIEGKNLVIEGPPGTGKSQTITNLIAAAMAQGKKVLFVAEKLAALEVVYSRLDKAGLGEFCLELHSHKSQKLKVLEEVDLRLKKHGHYRSPTEIVADIDRYEELKSALKSHARKINQPWKQTGKTLHEIFMAATRYRNELNIKPDRLHPVGYSGENFDSLVQRRNLDLVTTYQKVFQAIADQLDAGVGLQSHPWFGVQNTDLMLFDMEGVQASLQNWQTSLSALLAESEQIAEQLEWASDEITTTVSDVQTLIDALQTIPQLEGNELLNSLPLLRGDALINAKRYVALFDEIRSCKVLLTKLLGEDILSNLAIYDEWLAQSEVLERLVSYDSNMQSIADAIRRMQNMEAELALLNETFSGVAAALGNNADKLLSLSPAGLEEFQLIMKLVTQLQPSYWKHRDWLFDNDELDELLPVLRSELDELKVLQSSLAELFALERIPDDAEIHNLQSTLVNGGIFKWFKGRWRQARKQLKGYGIQPKIKYKQLLKGLDSLSHYAKNRKQLYSNQRYIDLLGEHLRGIETDIDMIEALRTWYSQVRKHYGIGFGVKVALGNAILDLPISTAQAIRSLSDQGIQSKLSKLQLDLTEIRVVFKPVEALQRHDILLNGEQSPIHQISQTIPLIISQFSPLTENDALTVAELISYVEKLGQFKHKVSQWNLLEFDSAIFNEGIAIDLNAALVDHDVLSKIRSTVNLADQLDRNLTQPYLRQYLYKNSCQATFETFANWLSELTNHLVEYQMAYQHFAELVKLDINSWTDQCGLQLNHLLVRNNEALQHPETLQSWLDYFRVRDQLSSNGLDKLIVVVENNELHINQAQAAYQAGIFDLLAREILHYDPDLARFSGHAQESYRKQFQVYDNKLKQLQSEWIAWRIDQTEVPKGVSSSTASLVTERSLLERECRKKTKHIPIRQLLQRAGGALVALKPCFMMSPMSVAQYLAPGKINFDLVVMDEASQIKPQDALGAIARGGQLVVVGDPKQLPPTSFFDRIVEDDVEDPTGIEESESILDATLPMFKARRLRWHYRSQHESLIAFSNQAFYDSDLVLFPSPNIHSDNYGIHYLRVQRGCFVNRRNMEEAKIISEAVREHFRSRPDESLGVVAMNAEQRLQIERAIETLSKDDALFQGWLEQDACRRESLFIKNLENVQGDERDVIFISMTYGPQEPNGKVPQRFGPINSDVGWRRLNVLFTRSKKRMHIFRSMGSEDIVVGSGSKRGVRALREFLSYCETGILHTTERDTGRAPDSDFEVAVANALREEGFECVPQVGVAGFFIDIAVIDPGNPGRYLMGIECDGMTYHSAKSTRDRDRLRQSILERLGWKIRRIWSTDWFKNPKGELAPIIRELHELKSAIAHEAPISEIQNIDTIVQRNGSEETQTMLFAFEEGSLKEKLIRFDRDIVRKAFPDTPENKRLLRASMVEALLEYKPTSKVMFLELIPSYIRQGTEPLEGKFLDQIFEIINTSLQE
jgi:very-short-patch-repair endonuclease